MTSDAATFWENYGQAKEYVKQLKQKVAENNQMMRALESSESWEYQHYAKKNAEYEREISRLWDYYQGFKY